VNITIIGTGNVGRALGGSLKRAGHDVTLAARDDEKAAETARRLGVQAATSPGAAAQGADVVILAVPADALESVAREVEAAEPQAVLVNVSNRMQPDLTEPSNAERLQRATNAPVVKAFNTAFASKQADPQVDGVPIDGYVAGDDPAAKERVLELVESAGFRPVDAGPLSAARMLEGMAWLNMSRNFEGGSWQSAWLIAEPGRKQAH
jgi:predicted dinucleotide-binding enzyme